MKTENNKEKYKYYYDMKDRKSRYIGIKNIDNIVMLVCVTPVILIWLCFWLLHILFETRLIEAF